jgi:hypothetical protein
MTIGLHGVMSGQDTSGHYKPSSTYTSACTSLLLHSIVVPFTAINGMAMLAKTLLTAVDISVNDGCNN